MPEPSSAPRPRAADQIADEQERIPVMQQILDNPFLLLFLGIVLPTVFYILWGIMEIVTIPVSPLAK